MNKTSKLALLVALVAFGPSAFAIDWTDLTAGVTAEVALAVTFGVGIFVVAKVPQIGMKLANKFLNRAT